MITLSDGSSPQARGTLQLTVGVLFVVRFIPAGAGNTRSLRSSKSRQSVHPRRRGEHAGREQVLPAGCGSSPQARGTPRVAPAWAAPSSVHPRRRGEHTSGGSWLRRSLGSSPQARGTRQKCGRHRWRMRFIPAGAGNTCTRVSSVSPSMVHPRRRGEHFSARTSAACICGSSPQARGTPEELQRAILDRRFIPAGAGNTATEASRGS